nr:MAG TPA: hypothetical protein [Caudoviricetes sp.]
MTDMNLSKLQRRLALMTLKDTIPSRNITNMRLKWSGTATHQAITRLYFGLAILITFSVDTTMQPTWSQKIN